MAANTKRKQQLTPQQRRQLAQKRRRRKLLWRRFVVVSCVALIVAVLVGLVYGFFALFKITEFEIEGAGDYTLEEVVSASNLEEGNNLFLSKLKPAEERLEVALPYIGEAQIRRVLPGTIVFKLVPTSPVCVLEYSGGLALVDANAKVLAAVDEKNAKGFMRLATPEPLSVRPGYVLEYGNAEGGSAYDADTIKLYKTLLEAMEYSGIDPITVMDLSDPNNVSLLYQDRIVLKLGVPAQVEKRLELAAEIIERENNVSAFQKGEIDLTVGSMIVFKPYSET